MYRFIRGKGIVKGSFSQWLIISSFYFSLPFSEKINTVSLVLSQRPDSFLNFCFCSKPVVIFFRYFEHILLFG